MGRESANWLQYGGALDEVRLWNVARTPAELQLWLGAEVSGVEPGLVAYWRFNEGLGTTVADDSPAEHLATLHGGPFWRAGGPLAPVVPDLTPPDITGIVGSNLTDSGLTVAFDTSEVTTGWLSYTLTTMCPCTEVYSAGPGTAHVITLSGLSPDTVYQFEVRATDAAGNLQVSPPMTFRTLVAAPVPPTVMLTSPVPGNVAGTVEVTATAAAPLGVAGVQFKLDGVLFGAVPVPRVTTTRT
jgi:hypothetical protein